MEIEIEFLLIVVSILFFVSILASKAGYRLGVPALLLFLGVGMLFGSDGLGIEFTNINYAHVVGTVALCIILFSGGMDTKINDIRPVIAQGITLATLGVLLTAITTGSIVWFVMNKICPYEEVNILTSLLLAATMSSTDSASVFSILRTKGVILKNNLRPMLELESGSNDPMAYILTITLISLIQAEESVSIIYAILKMLMQITIGGVSGFVLGKTLVYIINYMKIDNQSLYPIMVLTFSIFIFSSTYYLDGNSYLAVYIAGLVIGNSKFVHKRSTMSFFGGLSWLSQLAMFLTLGLLVNPHELIPIIIPGLIISLAMIFITRPISVILSLLPFRKMGWRDKTFVSWVGLRGAVPIIFAIQTLATDVPHSHLIFNIVFFCTLISLIIQGTTLPLVAKLLGVANKPSPTNKSVDFDIEFSEDIKSVTSEIIVTPELLEHGTRLMDLKMPENTLVIMVKRGEHFFVPTGKTSFKENDKLLIITDDQKALADTYEKLGIKLNEEEKQQSLFKKIDWPFNVKQTKHNQQ